MKIAILHQDLEWAETAIRKRLIKDGHRARLVDIRNADTKDLAGFDLVLNRVYASVANRRFRDNLKCLDILERLEALRVPCINSHFTSKADYSKYVTYQLLKQRGVPTPETIRINSRSDIRSAQRFADTAGFPLVLKRDMGGRAKDIRLLHGRQALKATMEHLFDDDYRRDYQAGFVLQAYHQCIRDFDCRIAVIDGEFAYAYGRTLMRSTDADPNWIGSACRGSTRQPYSPSSQETRIAIEASNSTRSTLNEIDMINTENGPMVIETNPTPIFFEGKDEERLETVVERVLESVGRRSVSYR